ncbi:MAG: RHS repeat-associated core domain-containing protein, partial [Desulfobacterales bacterium]|nr:RHS repeat-associated core domain-containing protein [Desulfobacterales bacterium]
AIRTVATLHPNHTWEKVVFDPWRQETCDVSDTVLVTDPKNDPDVGDFFRRLRDDNYLPTWHAQRQGGALGPQEKESARKVAIHADTPTVVQFDSFGRAFLTVAQNKFKYSNTPIADPPTEEFYETRIIYDIEGNQRKVIDAKGRIVMRYDYDMLGNRIHQVSLEAGERWMLNDVTGKPIRAWDSRNHQFRTAFDPLRRPTESYLREGTGSELLVGRTVYGETQPNPEADNLRRKVIQLFDQAGVVTSDEYDFKGNLLSSRRQLAQVYKTILDWSAAVPLEAPIYTSRTRYDALNRPIQLTAPYSDQPGTKINVFQPGYNEANLLEQVNVWLDQNMAPTDLLDPTTANLKSVTDIGYDAKGQRTLIEYGNGVRTTCEYDTMTFRLNHLLTVRGQKDAFECAPSINPRTCEDPPTICNRLHSNRCVLQNLYYTYDPVGNITHIRDDAQQTIYFRNKRVEPSAEYTYDAVCRLVEATGREHLGQIGGAPIPHSYDDVQRVGLLHPGDGNAMGRYLERYIYDAAGNILQMQHRGSDPVHPGWTRRYDYNEASLIEPAQQNNRLSSTSVGNNIPPAERYQYDDHGNMTRMPHLGGVHPHPNMHWDYRDQLRQTYLGGGTAYYIYDANGQRVRKVWEKSQNLIEERIYLGGFEIYRRRQGAECLERETLHIMDDRQHIALVETRTLDTAGNDPAPKQLIRYQFGNYLGSASLELDHQAQIISYEEYTPYGSTSYQAVRTQTETPKRYRYTGKERDGESGLYYHGARYYAPWIGRWLSTDPGEDIDEWNLYQFVKSNPLRYSDPTGRWPHDMLARRAYTREMTREQKQQFTEMEIKMNKGMVKGFFVTGPINALKGIKALFTGEVGSSLGELAYDLQHDYDNTIESMKQGIKAKATEIASDPEKCGEFMGGTIFGVATAAVTAKGADKLKELTKLRLLKKLPDATKPHKGGKELLPKKTPKAPKSKLTVEHSHGRYLVSDSANARFQAIGTIEDDLIEITIRSKLEDGTRSAVIRGSEQFKQVVDFFPQAKGIKANWQYGDNLLEFNKLTKAGLSPTEAAAKTWTGKQATKHGFTKIADIELTGTPGDYTDVKVIFKR